MIEKNCCKFRLLLTRTRGHSLALRRKRRAISWTSFSQIEIRIAFHVSQFFWPPLSLETLEKFVNSFFFSFNGNVSSWKSFVDGNCSPHRLSLLRRQCRIWFYMIWYRDLYFILFTTLTSTVCITLFDRQIAPKSYYILSTPYLGYIIRFFALYRKILHF